MHALLCSTFLLGAAALPAGVDESVGSFPSALVGTWEGMSSTWYRDEGLPGDHPGNYPVQIELYPQEVASQQCLPTEFGETFPGIDQSWCEENCFDGNGDLAPSCDPEESSPLCECSESWDLVWEDAGMIYYPSFGMNAVLLHVFPVSCDITYAGGDDPVEHSCFELVEDYYDDRSVGFSSPCNQFSYVSVALQKDGSLYYAWYQGGVAPFIATLYKVDSLTPSNAFSNEPLRPPSPLAVQHELKYLKEEWPLLAFDPPQPGQNLVGESPSDLVLSFNGFFSGVASNRFPPNEKHGYYSGPTFNVTYGPLENCSSFAGGECGEGIIESETGRSFNTPTFSLLNIFCEHHWEGPDPAGECWTYEHILWNRFNDIDQEFGTFSLQRDGSVWWTRMLGPLVFDDALLELQR